MLEDSVSPKKYEGSWADPIPQSGKARNDPKDWEDGGSLGWLSIKSQAVMRPHTPPEHRTSTRGIAGGKGMRGGGGPQNAP